MNNVIVISGKQGCGKTTTTKSIKEYLARSGIDTVFIKFADPLYEMHGKILSCMEGYGQKYEGVKHGPLLQYLGTEFGRNTYGDDVWVNIAKEKIKKVSRDKVVVIDDCRFKNEFLAFQDSLTVRLKAPREVRKERCENWRENETHQSEIDLDEWEDRFDLIYDTSGMETPDQIAEGIVFYLLNRPVSSSRI